FELIKQARTMSSKPILAKGIHADDRDIEQALEAGADYVLVVGRLPKVHLDKCWIEPNSLSELANLPLDTRAVWNARDLSSGQAKSASFNQARSTFSGW